MTKKLMVTIAAVAALASASPAAFADAFDGIHVGAGVGSKNLSVDDRLPGLNVRADKSKRETSPQIFAGFDKTISDRFVIGGELNVGLKNRDLAIRTNAVSYKAEIGKTVDLTARAGVLATDNLLLYGRAGVSRYKVEREAFNGTTRLLSSKKTETRPVYGVGAEYAFNDHVSLRGEYLRRNGKNDLKSEDITVSVAYKF
ncbi:outer membrane protein [Asticcacaulis sp. W401b]|uniref:outer membrane protein n=1 Tax=Asticcacaulis sp. W401b TaxID=3388666 RepID=UPI0039710C01